MSKQSTSAFCLVSGPTPAAANMAIDETLLLAATRLAAPVFRLYAWIEPAATFGYFQKYDDVERATLLRPLIRRPTGGGIVPHDADWTYSLAFPVGTPWYELRAMESYARVHGWVATAFAQLGVSAELAPCCKKTIPGQCFIGHEKDDVLWHGRKIAGAAQRRTRQGLLIQGSVQPPPLQLSRKDWEAAMFTMGTEREGFTWTPLVWDEPLQTQAADLEKNRYSDPAFNRKR